MADNIMDAFLLFVDENDDVRIELDKRIQNYKGNPENITKDVLVPYARELGYNMTVEDVELYNGHESDGTEVPEHLLKTEEQSQIQSSKIISHI